MNNRIQKDEKYKMKIIVNILCLVCVPFNLFVMSPLSAQEITPLKIGNTTRKIIEPAFTIDGQPNTAGKTNLHKLLFPSHNAKLEFFINDSQKGPSGFSFEDSLDGDYTLLNVLWISNWDEVNKDLETELPLKSFKGTEVRTRSKEELTEDGEFNKEQINKRNKRALERYKIDTAFVKISPNFANYLYSNAVNFLSNHVDQKEYVKSYGGYHSTFRCVVANEVWTLSGKPYSAIFKNLTDIFYQLVKETQSTGKIADETIYIRQLEEME